LVWVLHGCLVLLGTVHCPLLNIFSVCVKDFTEHCYVEIEPAIVFTPALSVVSELEDEDEDFESSSLKFIWSHFE